MKKILLPVIGIFLLLAGCAPRMNILTIMTHDSFAISEKLVADFEQENQVKLVFLSSGDSGSALNKAILSKNSPLADVFFGVDNTLLSLALEEGIFEPYSSPLLDKVPDEMELDTEHHVLPVDYGDVCINYDKNWFAEHDLPVPIVLEDLLKPEYRGLMVVENPATSSPGMAFLLATIYTYGEEGFENYWAALRNNEVVVAEGWETAYYTYFSGSSGRGPQPLVVSYASSPVAEFMYADPPVAEAQTASIVSAGACFRQVEFAGILAGTPRRALAEKFIDFLLGVPFQEDIPLQMFVYPVNQSARWPDVFTQWTQVVESPATLDPILVAENREEWITAWREIVLR